MGPTRGRPTPRFGRPCGGPSRPLVSHASRVGFMSRFREVHPPPTHTHLFLCLYKILRQNMAQIKGTLPDWNPGSPNFIIIEMKRVLIT